MNRMRAILSEFGFIMPTGKSSTKPIRTFKALTSKLMAQRRLLKVRGMGPQTATAIIAAIGDGSQFDKSRDLAAWLGLVPKLYSTGGRTDLAE